MKFIFLSAYILLAVSIIGCGNNVDAEHAKEIVENYIKENKKSNEEWYVSQSESSYGSWIIHVKLLGNDCDEKFFHINKKSGVINEIRGGNAC